MNRNMWIKYWCGMIESSNLECLSSIQSPPSSFWILNPPFFILLPQISFIQPQFSIFNTFFPASVKSTGYLPQKVLKIAWFPRKCPQAPLAVFSRSAPLTLTSMGWNVSNFKPDVVLYSNLKLKTFDWSLVDFYLQKSILLKKFNIWAIIF